MSSQTAVLHREAIAPQRRSETRSAQTNCVRLRTPCTTCLARELCLPAGLDEMQLERLKELFHVRQRVHAGQTLYRAGESFGAIYAIRSGFFKTHMISEDGRDQTVGFHMAGEIMGMEGIGTQRYTCDAVALEDSEVCIVPFALLEELSVEVPQIQSRFHKLMSRELVRDFGMLLLLGSMRAEERLAAFLLNLSQRFAARGYSASEFNLRMTREEIGSYLGLKLETVSRTLSRFQREGLIQIWQKQVKLIDLLALKGLVKA
ncbi:Fumarate and nitrate reduction regulatory protein [Burkholderiales bacterium]|nr:MAG: fumarate/nitrate reduction transcriptional regulator Fnr [Burkholderiales bacterium]CAG0952773.1 Fumarate and nitrate reduction regulatory protein [Burkholderiales bacterium]